MYIDSHAHLTTGSFSDSELPDLLKRSREARIDAIVNICTTPLSLENGLKLSKEYPWIFHAGSTTPHDVEKEGQQSFEAFAFHARAGHLVAIGETGLDYHYMHSNKELQKAFLIRYFHLALECHLPVVIHCRDAFSDFFEILDAEYTINTRPAPGVLHCFTGTIDEAKQVLERGWYLSLSGIVTFKKSEELREVAKIVPLDQLLIETDAPFLAPQRHRGKTNEPSFLPETAAVIAAAKGVTLEEVAFATSSNAKRFFQF